MNKYLILIAAILCSSGALAAPVDHKYLEFDENDRLIVSGPFEVIIPKPGHARRAGPVHSNPKFMREQLRLAKAGYFVDDRFVVIEIETTDAPAGSLSHESMPVIEMAGKEFHTRTGCVAFTQADLDAVDDPLLMFIQHQGFNVMPAVYVRQLFVLNDDRTAEGIILYGRRVSDCAAVTEEFEQEFEDQFGRFVESIRDANPE